MPRQLQNHCNKRISLEIFQALQVNEHFFLFIFNVNFKIMNNYFSKNKLIELIYEHTINILYYFKI